MATLNLSQNGPSISASYQKIVNSSPSGPASSSPTYAIWSVFSVKAPLANAFQAESGKESVLAVQTTGEGELADLIDEFSDGRIQFAFVKVKDPNTTLPKAVLLAWCGEGVPERTKGYFTSHLNAVARLLHGYHVQIIARSDRDLTPELIVQKVADSSGSKYGGGGMAPAPATSGVLPPVASKPVLPTKTFGAASVLQSSGIRSRGPTASAPVDEDGWGQDAPPVTRSQLEKVAPAYQPTQVNMSQLQQQREPSQFRAPAPISNERVGVVSGGYQPIGKVDIAAIRRQAQEAGSIQDDRPTVVKGAYEPVGKVDIADIRRKAQAAPPPAPVFEASQPSTEDDERPKSLADRSAAFQQSRPLTELPKPKVANRFGSAATTFTGTRAPAPGGFQAKPLAPIAPVGAASKTFADEGGKTPAQLWAERKARERGASGGEDTLTPSSSAASALPIQTQTSGGWHSGYGGKKWDVSLPTRTGGSDQLTGQEGQAHEENAPPTGGVGSIRDRFAGAVPIASAPIPSAPVPPAPAPVAAVPVAAIPAAPIPETETLEPPPLDTASKPNAGARGVPIPGLPQRPVAAEIPAQQHQDLPPPPPRPQPDDEEEEEEEPEYVPQSSPVRIAMPVGRGPEPIHPADPLPPRPVPAVALSQAIDNHMEAELDQEPQAQDHDPARGAAAAAAVNTFGHSEDPRGVGGHGGQEAIAQYDYEKDEENELALQEGERIVNIDMVDDDWWMGENSRGERGLFPSNYVELVQGGSSGPGGGAGNASAIPAHAPAAVESAAPAPPQPAVGGLPTATAEYDYEADEENELSFAEGAKIHNVEFPDENWWSGECNGKVGLFPANYVKLDT